MALYVSKSLLMFVKKTVMSMRFSHLLPSSSRIALTFSKTVNYGFDHVVQAPESDFSADDLLSVFSLSLGWQAEHH